MKNTTNVELLRQSIIRLEIKQAAELKVLKEQLLLSYESLSPFSLLKKTITDFTSLPQIKDGIISNAIGMTGGYLAQKILFGATRNPVRNLAGTISRSAISYWLTNNSAGIKEVGENILYKILKKWKPAKDSINNNGI
jgi:hypothetical protein